MGRFLIVNADDLGWSDEINAAVIDSHTGGVVTSTTLMTTMPGAENALSRLKTCSNLGVGVHLTLSAGVPVCADEAVRRVLAPTGEFNQSLLNLAWRARSSAKWRQAAQTELAAQIQYMLDRGLRPDHIDSHKHFHVVGAFQPMVVELASRFGIKLIRNTCEHRRVKFGSIPPTARLKRRLLLRWGSRAGRKFTEAGLVHPETFFGIEDTLRGDLERALLFLEQCRADSVEWMVHPGYDEAEKNMLTHPRLRDTIRKCGFNLVGFGELLK